MKSLRLAIAVVAGVAACASAAAQTILTNPASVTWYKSRSGDSITPGTNSVLFTEGQTSGSTFVMNFSPATVNVGHTLTLVMNFTTGTSLSTASNSFRFGIFNSGATQIAADFNSNTPAGNAFLDDLGYMAAYNFSGAAVDLRARTANTVNQLLSSTTDLTTIANSSGSGTTGAFAASTSYTLTMTLERTSSGYIFSSLLNGGNNSDYYRTALDTTSLSSALTSFNEFAFYVNGGSNAVNTINVTGMNISVIPEPSTYAALLGLAALGLAAYRRHHATTS